jgi:hypothetical protein
MCEPDQELAILALVVVELQQALQPELLVLGAELIPGVLQVSGDQR